MMMEYTSIYVEVLPHGGGDGDMQQMLSKEQTSKSMASMKRAIQAGHKDHGHMSTLVIKAILNGCFAITNKISAD
jgi:hypothetical protein